jgi:hypothetical protein
MKERVPSIGSTIQTRDAVSRAGPSSLSSDSQPASGTIVANRSFSSRLTAMSTSETGELCSLTQVLMGFADAARAKAPASRTTRASAFASGNRLSFLRMVNQTAYAPEGAQHLINHDHDPPPAVPFSGLAIGHSVDLVNGRRFFAAPRATPSCRYFDRFDRLLERTDY